MRSCRANSAALTLALVLGTAARAAEPPPFGHADFMPTPDRPMGYRGDGSGLYPAATPPLTFDEQSKKNLRWVTKMPWWSHSPPILVGRKVFVEAEPDTTLCLDADTGAVLWQDRLDLLETPTGGWAMHSGNGYPTACTDGAAIYRTFSGKPKTVGKKTGSYLVSYDLDGKRRWLAEPPNVAGLKSPLLVGDRVLVVCRVKDATALVAYDTATGKAAWGPLTYEAEAIETDPWGGFNATDGCLVRARVGHQDVVVSPGGWCFDPRTGKRLAKALPFRTTEEATQKAGGRAFHPLGIALCCHSPVVRANPDGSALVIFSASDWKGLVAGANREPPTAVPVDADLTQETWTAKKLVSAVRVLPCRLSLNAGGEIVSEQLWKEPATVQHQGSSGAGPHIALCGERIAVVNVMGNLAVLDLKTGRVLGKDFQPVYKCEYKTAVKAYQWDTPELNAARAEYNLTEEVAFGKGGGSKLETSLARMARAVYARTAVDSRNYLWLAHRWGEIYVLELNDNGFREVAHNKVNQPICWCSHAAPVFQGSRLYYRTWGHLYCFEDAPGPR